MNTIQIQGRSIGKGESCFIVAELSGNHHQEYEEAVELVKQAKAAGADAVKLQTYTPDTITLNSNREWFVVDKEGQRPESWENKTLYDLYKTAYTPWEWQPKLKQLADELGILLFSSPFDETAVGFLEQKVNPPCYKVASYEVVHVPLLKKIASTGKPVLMSIGFASVPEVELALATLRNNGAKDIVILHCATSYADRPNARDMNLRTIEDIVERFGVPAGFSDNNGGIEIPVAAAVLGGAHIVEKHFILDRSRDGLDARFSVEPTELKRIVQLIRRAEAGEKEEVLKEIGIANAKEAMGKVHYGPANEEERVNRHFRPGVWTKRDIQKGEALSLENIRVARPNAPGSLIPKDFEWLLGKRAADDIPFANPITLESIGFRVREAQQTDVFSILEIRNSKEARAQSLGGQRVIGKEEHAVWFEKQYGKEAENKCYVAQWNSEVVGYCRYDEKGEGIVEVSIAVAPEHSGKGLGWFLLTKSLEQFCAKSKGHIRAKVKKGNTASVRLFEKCGFRLASKDSASYTYAYSC